MSCPSRHLNSVIDWWGTMNRSRRTDKDADEEVDERMPSRENAVLVEKSPYE